MILLNENFVRSLCATRACEHFELCVPLLSSYEYSRTSRKRIPKMQRLSGRLLGVVVYKNRTTGDFYREEVLRDIPFMEDNLLHAISKLPHV